MLEDRVAQIDLEMKVELQNPVSDLLQELSRYVGDHRATAEMACQITNQSTEIERIALQTLLRNSYVL